MASDPLAPLLAALKDLARWTDDQAVPAVIIGGVAAGILGRPRVTRDVDALVRLEPSRWEAFLTAGTRFGFTPRVSDALAFAERARVLLVSHQSSSIDVDLSFAGLPFEDEAIARATRIDLYGLTLAVPTPEDLIIMKAIAGRVRDHADIASIRDAQPRLDLKRIRRWVKDFSAVLERPEIVADLERMLRRKRK